jgi:hypothetical protein
MPVTVDLSGLDRLIRRFRALGDLDASELMRSWERIIDEDNRKGVLAGTDKDGNPMAPVTYRPVQPGHAAFMTRGGEYVAFATNPKPLTKAQKERHRLGVSARKKRGVFAGFGPAISGLNNNLSSSEYRKLDGPPLAPRRGFSRVITNLFTGSGRDPSAANRWVAFGAWREVVDTKGRPFLQYHFNGEGSLPVRDLRGVRPEGMAKARIAAIEFMKSEIRRSGAT